ncbi:MAG: hypothetical protein ACOYM5_02895 [Caulobacter sp.]
MIVGAALPIDPAGLNNTDMLGLALTLLIIGGLIGLLQWAHERARERAAPPPCDGSRCPNGVCFCGRFE